MQEVKQKVSKIFFYMISVCYATEGIVDVVVGSTWPVIAKTIKVEISLIGIIIMLYYLGAIAVSPRTYKIRKKLGTNYTMVLSQICFCLALILYIIASNIYILTLGMFINGVGCGLMEVNAHSYVLKAYDVKGESILSSFWSIGSILGSTIMALAVRYYPPYKKGFMILVAILIINIIMLLFLKSKWVKQKKTLPEEVVNIHSVTEEEKKVDIKIADILKNNKIVLILICFFLSQGVIITLNALVSTIAATQGKIHEDIAVGVTILFFAAIFIGRMTFGHMSENTSVMKVLKMNSLVACVLLITISFSQLEGSLLCVLVIILGFVLSPIIPFFNVYIKDCFDTTLLSALLGYGDVCGIIGIILMSGLTTLILKISSVQIVEMVFAGIMLTLRMILSKVENEVF